MNRRAADVRSGPSRREDGCVRRRLTYLLVWLVATGATMGASWLGLRSVLDVATPHRAMPLSAAELRQSVAPTPSPTTSRPMAHPSGGGGSVGQTSASSAWEQVPDGGGGIAFKRTFHLAGGDLTVLSDSHEAKVLASRPKPGFILFVSHLDFRTIVASFISTTQTSRLYVTWRDGPYASISGS
jgi:hypothetical protein